MAEGDIDGCTTLTGRRSEEVGDPPEGGEETIGRGMVRTGRRREEWREGEGRERGEEMGERW